MADRSLQRINRICTIKKRKQGILQTCVVYRVQFISIRFSRSCALATRSDTDLEICIIIIIISILFLTYFYSSITYLFVKIVQQGYYIYIYCSQIDG